MGVKGKMRGRFLVRPYFWAMFATFFGWFFDYVPYVSAGVWLIPLGGTLNYIAVKLNGGSMPIFILNDQFKILIPLWVKETEGRHSVLDANTRCPYLCDRYYSFYRNKIVIRSIGDILVEVGALWFFCWKCLMLFFIAISLIRFLW